ncbi:MAG TPA: tRNA (adenosine(37)-N6)-dimethylallyltransferase MiaA [Myxococcota bacterium]|nr:tRNA (adenosine(37)-N6)-dimethylallyltransferase MiaA [Myxococcota bacterium]
MTPRGSQAMPLLCLMGTTASGKTALSIRLAEALAGEVVNGDSMQVFRGLEIGTAAPTPEERGAVPHHLFGIWEPTEEPDAARWARLAADRCREIAGRGRVPILVGGTFFWFRVLLEGLSHIPPVPREVRLEVLADLAREGPEALHRRLQGLDPAIAARLSPGDSQRVARALEVVLATGTPLSTLQQQAPVPFLEARVLRLAPTLTVEETDRRIAQRARRMFEEGIVDEVRRVLGAGCPPDARPLRTASYAPVVDLILGRCTEPEARERVILGHRQYAKRQRTWLRRESDLVRISGASPWEDALRVVTAFLREVRG